MNIDRIFLGVTPTKQRHFLKSTFAYLRSKGYKKIVITTVGEFHNAHSAIEAGFEPHQIETSDVGLYSSLLGYLASGQDIAKLGFEVQPPYKKAYDKLKDDTERVAYLFLLMKLAQLREGVYYEKIIRDESQSTLSNTSMTLQRQQFDWLMR